MIWPIGGPFLFQSNGFIVTRKRISPSDRNGHFVRIFRLLARIRTGTYVSRKQFQFIRPSVETWDGVIFQHATVADYRWSITPRQATALLYTINASWHGGYEWKIPKLSESAKRRSADAYESYTIEINRSFGRRPKPGVSASNNNNSLVQITLYDRFITHCLIVKRT